MAIKYNPSTVDISSNFAIGTYNLADNPNLYEIARSNNFEFIISDFDNLQPASSNDTNMTKLQKGQEIIRMSVTRTSVPHFSQEIIRVRRGNNELKYAGVPTFGEGSLVVNDYIGAQTKDYLMAWQNLSYNVITEKVGLVQDYKKNCTLIEYSPDYQVVRSWTLYGCWISGLSEDDFDSDNGNSPRRVTATIQYDHAKLDADV
jgi:hypothetical protein